MILLGAACNKLLEVPSPVTSTNADIVYRNDASAIATLNNIYTIMSQNGITSGLTSLSLYTSLSSDELKLFRSSFPNEEMQAYYTNSLMANNTGASDFWKNIYSKQIFLSNSAIEGLLNSNMLTPIIKERLLGEAYFIRAFSYFYLVALFGDVPLVLTTDYKKNSDLPRLDKKEIYKQIVADLKIAKKNLSEEFLNGTLLSPSTERIMPTKWAAHAMLARVGLYTNDWNLAELEADSVILNKSQFDTVSVEQAFLADNKETIWQLQSVSNTVTNTSDAQEFLFAKVSPSFARVYLNPALIDQFEKGDLRRVAWIDSVLIDNTQYYLPGKYKIYSIQSPVMERTNILRLSEQYLIRAEARLHSKNVNGALSDINVVRTRAKLKPLNVASEQILFDAILKERKFELFTEWGHRWFDLIRTGKVNDVMLTSKPEYWQATDQLYPIPLTEIEQNPALVGHQNPGY